MSSMLVAENVPYYVMPPDDYAAERCTVTVERPARDNYPVFVYFHGGALEGGDRQERVDFSQRMLGEGFGVVSAHYRLSPRARCPDYLNDAAAAVAWTLEQVQRYGGDPRQVFVTGHSAGGYLAAMVCLAEQFLAAAGGHHPREILGCVTSSGQMLTHYTIRKERGIPIAQPVLDTFAPLHYAHRSPMPMLLIAGSEDVPGRVEENALMAAVRRSAGYPTELLIVPGRDHTTIHHGWREVDDPVATRTLALARRFLRG